MILEKSIKCTIEIIGFPFTLTNMFLNKRNKVEPIGLLVKVKDKYIHTIVSRKTEANCTVILDAGLSCCSVDWHYIQPQVSKIARVISFDRAGYGWSSSNSTPYTSEDVVADLLHILDELQLRPPYILVGHSFGGLNMRLFASKYPEMVASLILIDSVHEKRYLRNDWDNTRKKTHRKNLNTYRLGYITSGIGLPKLLKQPVGRKYLPGHIQKYVDYIGYQPKSYEAVFKEFLYSEKSALQIKNAKPLNTKLPVTVISSNNPDPIWIEHQNLLSKLTNHTTQLKTDNSHSIHLENPDLVINEIKKAVNSIE